MNSTTLTTRDPTATTDKSAIGGRFRGGFMPPHGTT
jgi:hypothetical protein